MKSSNAVSSSQPDVVQRVESVSEAEPNHSSDPISESELMSEAELVAEAKPVSEGEPAHAGASEEEPAHAGATIKPAQTPKVEVESKSHASCHEVKLLGWVIPTIAAKGKVGFIAPVVQRRGSNMVNTTTKVK